MKFTNIFCAMMLSTGLAKADNLKIVTDIAPVGSLVSRVAGQDVTVLIEPGQSPHNASLKPSMARALEDADVVIWMGEGLLPGLEKPIAELAGQAKVLTLLQLEDVAYLEPREEAVFEEEHDDHDGDHDHHDHGEIDPHAWLSSDIAIDWLGPIAATLGAQATDQAATYRANADAATVALTALSDKLKQDAAPLRDTQMIAQHDAFQYLEGMLGLSVSGAVTDTDDNDASAKRLSQVKGLGGVSCLLVDAAEPTETAGRMADLLGAEAVALDILGATHQPGPALYAEMMRGIVRALQDCARP